ncbi:MAG: hypothetical protein AUH42_02495 [Gemmatimonadetes bacterium 13_1_40CM_70_11]|nr:MAG: hypothetical protein AUH42_02495 [Gemmatimonadetes bacterium 13_1_40CM_70_11]
MTAPQWARLNTDEDFPIRRGGWYRVLQLTPREVTVDVKGRQIPIPRTVLEVVAQPTLRWAVVPRPRHAPRLPPGWGPAYGVCPGCRERVQLIQHPQSLRCPKCNGFFEVGWGDPYLSRQVI